MKKVQVKNEAAYNVTFNYNVVPEHPVHSVLVLGDFNEWSYENGYVLKSNKKGDFEGTFKIPAGREYHFRYLVNGERWANEKDADKFEASPLHPHIDNSVLNLPALAVEKAPAKKAAPAKKESTPKAATPKVVTAKKDDLTKIEGIGPKIAELLGAAGIHTFANLASAKKSTLEEVLSNAGSKFAVHDPSTWAQQAKLAAAASWDELKKLQDVLKGGKKK